MSSEIEEYLAKRNAVLNNPTEEGALSLLPPGARFVDATVPLAAVHKARLLWTAATDEQRRESREWLSAHGYRTSDSLEPSHG